MIGWKPKPFIFVHVPKCAGTSIETAFIPTISGCAGFKELSQEDRRKYWLPGNSNLQHSKLQHYKKHFRLDDYFKFTFIRNPWDRTISQIDYLRNTAQVGIFRGKSMKEQIRIYCTTKAVFWGQDLGACQIDYFQDEDKKINMDFIGRFESLIGDFEIVCAKIGINPPLKLPHVFNSRRRRHYSEFYDEESECWIRKRFARDIEAFGYEFEKREPTRKQNIAHAELKG